MSAELLRDLARAKVAFQLRAIEAVIRGHAIADTHAKRGDAQQAPSLMSGGGAGTAIAPPNQSRPLT
jgi:hypothetical protein